MRPAPSLALLPLAFLPLALLTVPAGAAPQRVQTGSFTMHALPDPTGVTADAPFDVPYSRCGVVGGGVVDHRVSEDYASFVAPAAGTLTVTLDMVNPVSAGQQVPGLDWDLRIFDAKGRLLSASAGPDGHERTVTRLQRRQPVAIVGCNDSGFPDARVSYVFRYA